MKVLLIGYPKDYNHARLIYLEAKRQGLKAEYIVGPRDRTKIILTAGRYRPDWIFLYPAAAYSKEFIFFLRRFGKVIIWDNDDLSKGRDKGFREMNGAPDIVVSCVLGIAEKYQHIAPVVKWVPQYYDSEFYKPTLPKFKNEKYDVVFVGRDDGDPKRINWLKRLDSLFKLKVAGKVSGFPDYFVYGSEMANLYRQSRIAIDICRGRTVPMKFQTSDRIYKAMGCGCFYLTFPIQEIERLFIPGVHLDTYDDTFEGLVEKIRYYLNNETKRREIAARGEKEVLEKHTLKVRLREYWALMENYENESLDPRPA